MFLIIWFLIIAFSASSALIWLINNNGVILIHWLGYEVRTDILTSLLMSLLFILVLSAISYLLARILAMKFPIFLKKLFKKNYLKSLEKIIYKNNKSFDLLASLMLSLEVEDEKNSAKLHKKLSKLIKNDQLEGFILGKRAFQSQKFAEASEIFSDFKDNPHAKILSLKSKMQLALHNKDDVAATAYAQQILSLKSNNLEAAKDLFSLYKKRGLWQDTKVLITKYGSENFKDELQKRDLAVINTALASEAYQKRKFLVAIKYTSIALKAEENFLPALEIYLRSWLKLGFTFKARWKIKSLWRHDPHLILAKIYDLTYRKKSSDHRIKSMKKLANINSEAFALGRVAIALSAFRSGSYKVAKRFLNEAISHERTYRSYRLLAFTEKALGDDLGFKDNLAKSEIFRKKDHYFCNSCGYVSAKWSAKCNSCSSYDSLEWNS